MPICPKCKNEYRKGITICADCGCELVEEEVASVEMSLFLAGDMEHLTEMDNYLKYCGIKNTEIKDAPEGEEYPLALYVQSKELITARKHASVFIQQKQEQARQEAEARAEEQRKMQEESMPRWIGAPAPKKETAPKQTQQIQQPVGVYMNKAERAAENKSSAFSLIFVGVAGLALLVCVMLDMLPVHFEGLVKIMVAVIIGGMFIGFIIMGIYALMNMKKYAEEADTEKKQRDEMVAWIKEKVDVKFIDEKLGLDQITEEEWYFRRTEVLRYILNQQFPGLNQEFLEHFVDEMYDELY